MLRPMDYERKLLKQNLQNERLKKIIVFCVTAKCGIVLTKGRVQVVIAYNSIHIT